MTDISSADFKRRIVNFLDRYEQSLPPVPPVLDWSRVHAARWVGQSNGGWLKPLADTGRQGLSDLVGVDRQKQILEANTEQFVKGLPANNALLWGARGTGKSSLVRALLSNWKEEGLRLIEMDKSDLVQLPALIAQISGQPWRFLLYCDDLAFEAGDSAYKTLKTVLDGSIEVTPDNLLLYATSNRRHLLPEQRSDNLASSMVDGELHPGEAIEEKIALSDRFGLWVSFYPFTQEHYLDVVHHWLGRIAEEHSLQWQWDDSLQKEAVRWATARGNRNGRCAWQFARSWVGRALLAQASLKS